MLKRKMKMKGVVMDSSPSYVYDEETKTRFKYQTLMQDYTDLFKETEEKKRKLQLAKRRRRVALAEVRFLRQRYEELMEYQSREQDLARTQVPKTHRAALPIERSRNREAALPNPSPVLDLNQIANDDEEEVEVQNALEPMEMETIPMKFSINRGGKPPLPPRQRDMKLTLCRDFRKGSKATGKRKNSLEDPVALRV